MISTHSPGESWVRGLDHFRADAEGPPSLEGRHPPAPVITSTTTDNGDRASLASHFPSIKTCLVAALRWTNALHGTPA